MIFYEEKIKNNSVKVTLLLVGILVLFLALIDIIPTKKERALNFNMSLLEKGDVVNMGVAPDGTVLWAKKIGDDIIYFPSAQRVSGK